MRCAAIAILTFAAACASSPNGPARLEPGADARAAYYSKRIAKHPDVYALRLGLAQAYLDKARATHDPAFLKRADAEADLSLARIETVDGFKMKARVAAFRHKFGDALEWIDKAAPLAGVDTPDGGLVALKVEALMGLKRQDEARALLPATAEQANDFHLAAAFGHWLKAAGRLDEAAAAFVAASNLAQAQRAPQLAGWAETMAAGVYLDAGHPDEARPHLAAAATHDARSLFFRTHLAELAALEGRNAEALSQFEALIDEAADPELHRRAFLAARAAGDFATADRHFKAAEASLTRVLAAGETFTLGELERLYVDGGASREEAQEKARSRMPTAD